jgi:hypothetical protein
MAGPNVTNLNLLNVILPFGPAAQSGITAYYPSIGAILKRAPTGAVGPPVVANYQVVQSNFVAQVGQPALNFLPPLQAANDGGNSSTDVSTIGGGGVVLYGTNAGLSGFAAASYPSCAYLATDNGAVYVSNGSTWLQILGPA